MRERSGPRPTKVVEIVAHRGASAYEPENTLRAIRAALDLGADAIEVDVRASKDGHVVVIHDASLDRTTNGTGYVRDHDLVALRGLDAGRGEQIPLLTEVFEAVNSTVPLLIEIKEPETVPAVASVVTKNARGDGVRIISFHESAIKAAGERMPKTERGLIVAVAEEPPESLVERCLRLHGRWLLPRHTMTTEILLEAAQERGLRVIPWTIDDVPTAARFLSMGVDGIATNRPDLKSLLT